MTIPSTPAQRFPTEGGEHAFTRAPSEDVADIVALLRDDDIDAGREGADLSAYLAAFEAVAEDLQQYLAIVRGTGASPSGLLS